MFSLKNEKASTKVILLLACLTLFLVSLYCIFKYGNATLLGNLEKPDNDDVKFIRSAWILTQTGNYVYHFPPKPTVFMMPGLPFTLAFLVTLFGKFGALTAFRIIQAFVQVLCLVLVFLIGRKVFDSKVGILAVVINVLYFADVWVANLILTETFFKFFVLGLVYFSIFAIDEKKLKYYIMAAVAWGLATLFRPTIATFPVVILLMWLIRRYSWREVLKRSAVAAVIFCAILSPWWIRNYQIFHRFIPLTLASGNPMLQGTFINYDRSTKATDGLNYSQFKYPTNSEIGNNAVEIGIAKYRLKSLVPKQPLEFLAWYTFGKAFHQINAPFYWISILGVARQTIYSVHAIVILLAIMGILTYYRQNNRGQMGTLLFAMIVYFILVYLPFFAFSRYFYPAIPIVIIFAAFFLANCARVIKVLFERGLRGIRQ